MFGNRRKAKTGGGSAGWGNSDEGFWGGTGARPDTPPTVQAPGSQHGPLQSPPGSCRNLLDLIEPVFLFICGQHRVIRDRKPVTYEIVRARTDEILSAINAKVLKDPVMRQQFERIKDPLLWYIDYWFGSSGAFPALRDKWNANRLGEYPNEDDEGSLSGDEAFFDHLDRTLATDVSDDQANERLAFFYVALGLGFTGLYFKPIPEHHEKLRGYMGRLYPRVRRFVEANPGAKLTPEAYDYCDRRDFVAPVRDRPMIMLCAALCLVITLFIGYMYLYGRQKAELESRVQEIMNTRDASH